MNPLRFFEQPQLFKPYLILCFDGWPNAGDVSTGVHDYLADRLAARPLACFRDGYAFDMTEHRPVAKIRGGVIESLEMPDPVFRYYRGRAGEPDLVLFKGPEPLYGWDLFCDRVFDFAREMDVRAVIAVGGSYDYVPHWLPAEISVCCSDPMVMDGLGGGDEFLMPSNYQGEISIQTLLVGRAAEAGFPALALWGHAPIYIQTGNLKIHRAIVRTIASFTGMRLDTGDLVEGIEEMERRIEELAGQNSKLAGYIEELRQEYDLGDCESDEHDPKPPARKQAERMAGRGKVISMDAFLRRNED